MRKLNKLGVIGFLIIIVSVLLAMLQNNSIIAPFCFILGALFFALADCSIMG